MKPTRTVGERIQRLGGPCAGAIGMVLALSVALGACASPERRYTPQIEQLASELFALYPTTTQEVCEFAAHRSHRVNLGLKGVDQELHLLLEEEGERTGEEGHPWYRKVLFAYLLALCGSTDGFETTLRLLEEDDLTPEAREGLTFCGFKYLGFTEVDAPAPAEGWEADLAEWREILSFIEDSGLQAWRKDYLRGIILSGRPGSGDEAMAAGKWLTYTLEPRDISFMAGLLQVGSPRWDEAVVTLMEGLLIRRFLPLEEEEGSLDEGIAAFREWYESNAFRSPDQWITDAFVEAGYSVTDLYNQTSISKIVKALRDDSENWILIRSHALAALNRICGFHADRGLIFAPEEVRQEVAIAYLAWYQDLAEQVTGE